MNNNIKLLILHPHSSYFTQPLNIGVFGPLKEFMAQEIAPLISTKIVTVKKFEWLEAYIKARAQALISKNINGSWRGAGLVPFLPQKVYGHIKSNTPTPLSIPPPVDNPFNKALVSSPFNIPMIQIANVALADLLQRGDPINTPVHQYITQLTTLPKKFHTHNSILTEEKSRAEEVLNAQKKQESGKRGILKGLHSLSNLETLEKIHAEGAKTKEQKRKSKKPVTTEAAESIENLNVDKKEKSQLWPMLS
jgi:hypothetical protein